MAILSDNNEIEVVQGLHGDDAQAFVDVIDEVPSHTLSSRKNGPTDFSTNLHFSLVRFWISRISYQGTGGSA